VETPELTRAQAQTMRKPHAHSALKLPKRNYQPACKPGSVWTREGPRRPFIWDAHC